MKYLESSTSVAADEMYSHVSGMKHARCFVRLGKEQLYLDPATAMVGDPPTTS